MPALPAVAYRSPPSSPPFKRERERVRERERERGREREIWREEVFSLEERRRDAESGRKNLCGSLGRPTPFPFIAFLEQAAGFSF